MSTIVINPAQFNPSALTAPGVYEIVIPPQAYIPGAPASVSGLVGTASWGSLNTPQLVGNTNELNTTYGTISTAALTDLHDLATDVTLALGQAGQSGLTLQCVRVSDGTDVKASANLTDGSAHTLITVVVGGSKTTGDTLALTFTATGITGGSSQVSYTVLSGDTLTTIAGALAAAINADTNLSSVHISAIQPVGSQDIFITCDGTTSQQPVVTNTSTGTPTETLTITSAEPIPGGTLTALYSGVLGNQISCLISAGLSSTLVNVLLTPWGGKAQEFYQNLPNTSGFWAALQNVLAMGTQTQGPSQLCRFTPATEGNPGAPALGTTALTGGTDGRNVNTANLLGSATGGVGGSPSGIYATLNTQPPIQQAWVVGLTDATAYPTLVEVYAQNAVFALVGVPINTSVSTAVSILQTSGAANWELGIPLDWCLIYDSINQVQRYVVPLGIAGGLISSLSPEQSPLNKAVYGVLGTPRVNSVGTGSAPYSQADIGLANTSGIMLITNPIPAGNQFGFATGVNTYGNINAVQSPVEYSRMTNFLLQSVGAVLGQYVGQLQTTSPADRLRATIKGVLDAFFVELENNNQLTSHNTICDLTNNTPQTIAQHILRVDVQAQYEASVWYLIFTLQGGTTVNISAAVITPTQPTGA